MKHALKITEQEAGAERSRMVVEVNGYEVEILADQDGVGASLTQIKDGLLVDECGTDWPDEETGGVTDDSEYDMRDDETKREETAGSCGNGCGCSRAA